MKMDLEFECKVISIEPYNNEVKVSAQRITQETILGHFTIKEIISYYGYDTLLDEIGMEKVKEYFDLTETP